MLVICPKCAASYNVPDEKIPENGARTKCATCGTSFRIEKVPQDLAAPVTDDPFATAGQLNNGDVSDLFGSSEDLASGNVGGEDLTPTMVFDPTQTDRRGPKIETHSAATKPSPKDYPDFDWPDPAESGGAGGSVEPDPFSASLFQPALDEAQGKALLEQKVQRTSHAGVVVRRPISKRRRAFSFYLLMVLIAAGGGYVAVNVDKYAALNWTELYYLAFEAVGLPSPRPVPKPIVIGATVRKVYEETTMAGDKLLVVEGELQNLCDTPQEQLSIAVTFSDEDGNAVTTRTAFAGNVLSSIQLKTLPLAQVFALHDRPLGAALNNVNVAPQASVPFQVVFAPAPEVRSKISVLARSAQSPALPKPAVSEAEALPPANAAPVSTASPMPAALTDSSPVPSSEAVTKP